MSAAASICIHRETFGFIRDNKVIVYGLTKAEASAAADAISNGLDQSKQKFINFRCGRRPILEPYLGLVKQLISEHPQMSVRQIGDELTRQGAKFSSNSAVTNLLRRYGLRCDTEPDLSTCETRSETSDPTATYVTSRVSDPLQGSEASSTGPSSICDEDNPSEQAPASSEQVPELETIVEFARDLISAEPGCSARDIVSRLMAQRVCGTSDRGSATDRRGSSGYVRPGPPRRNEHDVGRNSPGFSDWQIVTSNSASERARSRVGSRAG